MTEISHPKRRHGRAYQVAALLIVLLGGLATTGTRGVISADEGAMLAELDLLDRAGEWSAPNPEPQIDPGMDALPLELSDRTDDGRWAPFVKHPTHIALLLPAWSLAGEGGVLAMSAASVAVAAACGALLAERLRPGTGTLALWAIGLGSPLVFDGYQVVAHAMGAATAGLAVAALLAAERARSASRRALCLGASGTMVFLTGWLRSEGVLLGLALGAGLAIYGWAGRRRGAAAAGLALGAVAAAARLSEPVLRRQLLGAGLLAPPRASKGETGGLLGERWSGFRITVLDEGYGVDGGEVLLLVALVLAVTAAVMWRRRGDEPTVRLLAVAAAACAIGRMLTADFLVPGLLPALPAVAVGIVLLRRDDLRGWPLGAAWLAAGLFAATVLATQYSTGGTGEWGGRYFAIALPILVPAALVTIAGATESMTSRTRRLGLVCLCVIAATLSIGAVRAARDARAASNAVADAVIAGVDRLDVEATISTNGAISRFAWDDVVGEQRWFTVGGSAVEQLTGRLAASGSHRIALVSRSLRADLGEVAPAWQVEETTEVRPGTTVVLLTR